jgi:opacity protein-like surface antigen
LRLSRYFLIALPLLLYPDLASSQASLFYIESQAVGGYSSARDKAILYSMSPDDPMQKPSVGFDYLQRLSGASRDYGNAGLQLRLAYNQDSDRDVELQVYNAYLRYKASFANLWIGHDRPALGLSSYFDTHGLLLQTLAMMGYGFDRDWGVGLARDFDWGSLSASMTTGSGMPLHFKGNHLASVRISEGVLEQENHTIGLSAAYGEILETMGYELVSPDPISFQMASIDLAYLWTRFENRLEFMGGKRMNETSYALYWRLTMNLLEENRLKLEAKQMGESTYALAAGISYQATVNLALRAIYRYDDTEKDNRIVAQVYYYIRM